jgi:hypothetical protein
MIGISRIPIGRMTPIRVVLLAVPLAGQCIGSVVMRTDHQVHWMPGFVVLLATVGVAANLAFQFLILQLLIRVLRRRGVTLLDGAEPPTVIALLAAGTAIGAAIVLAMVRMEPGMVGTATALFTGLTLLAAMAAAAMLEPKRRLPARRALVVVFASQLALTVVLRVL